MAATALSCCMIWGIAEASDPHVTIDELFMLPSWCQSFVHVYNGTERVPPPNKQTLRRQDMILKSGCVGTWHFCWGLVERDRATFKNENIQFNLSRAVSNGDYVITHSGPKCILFPEIHLMAGEALTFAGNGKEAEKRFAQALKLKPGYAKAFIGLSDLYEQQGLLDKSIATLEQGIKANPRSSALKKKLKRVQSRASGGSGTP